MGPRLKKYANLFVVLFVVVVGLAEWWSMHHGPGGTDTPLIEPTAQEKAFVAGITEKAKQIAGPAHVQDSLSEKETKTLKALHERDFALAERQIKFMLAQSRMHAWEFSPFSSYIRGVGAYTGDDYSSALVAWLSHDPKSALAHLLRAIYLEKMAWQKRGTMYFSETDRANQDLFSQYNEDALKEVNESIRLDPADPYAYLLKFDIVRGALGNSSETEQAFQDGISKFPDFYDLYSARLESLEPKWGGTLPDMYLFVRHYASGAHSPMKVLYLDLYSDLMEAARLSCRGFEDVAPWRGCVLAMMEKTALPEVKAGIVEALELYNYIDKHDYNEKIREELNDIAGSSVFDQEVASIVQIAAEKTGSDNQLVENNPGHNDFIMDLVVAGIWNADNNYSSAQIKFQEALQDLERAPYSDENERAQMRAHIMTQIAASYQDARQLQDALLYNLAARDIDPNSVEPHSICGQYYKLGDYAIAVTECTDAINRWHSIEAKFWRGQLYNDLKFYSAAEKDLTEVADSDWSQTSMRTSAATTAALLLAKRAGQEAALAFYQKHPYMFDERFSTKQDLSITYNNRCYALMQLKDYKAALDDCNKSLTYGILPDAVNKRQQLMKILTVPAKNL